jgi:hypothetical protein
MVNVPFYLGELECLVEQTGNCDRQRFVQTG